MRSPSTQEQEEFVGLRFIHRPAASVDAPLIVLVHGRAGNGQVMWTFERALPPDCWVVSFEAFLPDALGGFSWWEMNTTAPVRPAILRARDRLCYAIERYIELEGLRPSSKVALGFSQGSVLLSSAVLTGSLALDGLGILAGVAYEGEEAPRLLSLPQIFIAHGIQDEVLSVEKARSGAERLRALGLSVTYVEEDVGHKVGIEGTRALKEWLTGPLQGAR